MLIAAAPQKPRVAFSAPAAYKPVGKLDEPFSAVLPNGRLVHPLGKSVALSQHPLSVALAHNGAYAVVVGSGMNGSPGVSVVDVSTMTPVPQNGVTLPLAAQAAAVLRDPRAADREVVVVAPVGKPELDLFDIAADGTLTEDATPTIALPGAPGGATALVVAPHGGRLYAVGSAGVETVDMAARATVGDPAAFSGAPAGATAVGTRLAVVGASSVSLVETSSVTPESVGRVSLDGALDPLVKVGGVQPSAVTASPDGTLYVALANADRVDVFQSGRWSPRYDRVASIDLSLYHQAPFGTAPDALALAPGGKQLYAALAGIDAVAVVDVSNPKRPRRLGLIPAGWFPSALAFSRARNALLVGNAFGDGTTGTLQAVSLTSIKLAASTMDALRDVRIERPIGARDPVVPQAPAFGKSRYIDHIVYLEVNPSTYDATFGDLQDAAGDPTLAIDGARKTPNLHALALRYAVASNFYAVGRQPQVDRSIALGGVVTVAMARRAIAQDDAPLMTPDDFPRFGFLYNNLARHHLSFRDYGDASWLAILDANQDASYAQARDDGGRAQAFIADYDAQAAAGHAPAFASVQLTGLDVSAQDRAVGAIVAALSKEPTWAQTTIIVAPRGVDGKDHVDPLRSYAVLIGPNVKRHYVGRRNLSYASILKTEEEILGLPALSLGDLLASDLADFFTTTVDTTPYVAVTKGDENGQGPLATLP